MIIPWPALPLWQFYEVEGVYVVKVELTAVETSVTKVHRDQNVRIEIHSTGNNRLIGYTLKAKSSGKKPFRLIQPSYIALFYSGIQNVEKKPKRTPITAPYFDQNIRLLCFGRHPRDYMLVLRRQDKDVFS